MSGLSGDLLPWTGEAFIIFFGYHIACQQPLCYAYLTSLIELTLR